MESSKCCVIGCHPSHTQRQNIAYPLNFMNDCIGIGHAIPVLHCRMARLANHRVYFSLDFRCKKNIFLSVQKKKQALNSVWNLVFSKKHKAISMKHMRFANTHILYMPTPLVSLSWREYSDLLFRISLKEKKKIPLLHLGLFVKINKCNLYITVEYNSHSWWIPILEVNYKLQRRFLCKSKTIASEEHEWLRLRRPANCDISIKKVLGALRTITKLNCSLVSQVDNQRVRTPTPVIAMEYSRWSGFIMSRYHERVHGF